MNLALDATRQTFVLTFTFRCLIAACEAVTTVDYPMFWPNGFDWGCRELPRPSIPPGWCAVGGLIVCPAHEVSWQFAPRQTV